MDPMVFVTYLCGYGFISALLSLIPSAIARSRDKNYFGWWIGSFSVLVLTVFLNRNDVCVFPIVFLVVLCIAAFVKFPLKPNEAIKN